MELFDPRGTGDELAGLPEVLAQQRAADAGVAAAQALRPEEVQEAPGAAQPKKNRMEGQQVAIFKLL